VSRPEDPFFFQPSMRRARPESITTVVRGFPVELIMAPGVISERKQARWDLWFLLLGKLHEDPPRFRDEEEVIEALLRFMGRTILDPIEKQLYAIDNPLWLQLRTLNKSASLRCELRILPYIIEDKIVLQAQRKKLRIDSIRLGMMANAGRIEDSIVAHQSQLGRTLSESLRFHARYGHFPGEGPEGVIRAKRVRVHGIATFGFRYDPRTYRDALAMEAATEYATAPIPGAQSKLLIGFEEFDRSCIVTIFKLPRDVSEEALRDALCVQDFDADLQRLIRGGKIEFMRGLAT
jgi:hypothetical protein